MSITRTFAYIVDGEVFSISDFWTGHQRMMEIAEALASDPKFINCTSDENAEEIGNGWTWDGINFYPPAQ